MFGQLSAEMLIVIVVILGVSILLAGTMLDSAKNASEKITAKSNDLLKEGPDGPCESNDDCRSGICDGSSSLCE